MPDNSRGNLYHLILGLPENAESPNHYELLGLEHRTGDSGLINKAAADQNRKLLHWQNSDRYAEVRALTLEVVKAREVLLNEVSRTAYDAGLGDWGLDEDGPWIVEEPPPLPLSVRCPECEAGFKLRNRELLGRRMPCPECGFRFTVREEQETIYEVAELEGVTLMQDSDAQLKALDNFDDMADLPGSRTAAVEFDQHADEYEDYEHLPSRSRRAAPRTARRSRARSPRSRSSNQGAAIAGGLLMAVGLVALLGLLFQKASSPPARLEHQLAYLPADCQSIGYYRLGEVSRSPFFQDHLTRAPQSRSQVDQFRERTGMELQDLESVVIGLKDNDPNRFQSLGMMAFPYGLRFVAVARAAKDWDRSRLIGDHTESVTHGETTYHVFSPQARSPERWALYLPDARTLIFGTVPEVEASIDTGGREPDWPDMEFLQPEYPLLTASVGSSRLPAIRGPGPVGMNMPASMSATNQGGGLVLAGDEVRQVAFLKFEIPGDAAEFVRTSQAAEDERRHIGRAPELTFRQHGRTVAVSQGGMGRIMDARHGSTAAAPLCLLAGLGNSSVLANNSLRP